MTIKKSVPVQIQFFPKYLYLWLVKSAYAELNNTKDQIIDTGAQERER